MKNFIPMAIVVVVLMGLRVRRMMVEQIYRPATVWTRLALLVLLALFILIRQMGSHAALAGVALGFVAGLVLGGYSIQRTHFNFEATPPRYKTNPYIGALVVTLFAIRILYDIMMARYQHPRLSAVDPIASNWLSATLYFLFVAYWGVYYVGLIRGFRQHRK